MGLAPLVYSGCCRRLWMWRVREEHSLPGHCWACPFRVMSNPSWIPMCLASLLSQILHLPWWGQERPDLILLPFLEEKTELLQRRSKGECSPRSYCQLHPLHPGPFLGAVPGRAYVKAPFHGLSSSFLGHFILPGIGWGMWRLPWVCFHRKDCSRLSVPWQIPFVQSLPLPDPATAHLGRDERIAHLALYWHCSGLPAAQSRWRGI